jgi:transposase InsO family protein
MASPEEPNKVPKRSQSPQATVEKEVFLAKLYTGKSAGAFRGPKALYQEAQKLGRTDISLNDCRKYLASQPPYTLYRPNRIKYPRNPIVAHYCGHTVEIDLMDMPLWVSENDNCRYVMLSYDVYSKFVFAVPLVRKTTDSLMVAAKYLIESLPFEIHRVYSDRESGMMSRSFQAWFKEKGIVHYTTTSKVKCPGVERLIRTLRTAIQRYFESTGSRRWLDYLDHFVRLYNDRRHSTTKQRPWDVVVDPTIVMPLKMQSKSTKKLPPIGSLVRVSRLRSQFEKEASGTWSRETFRVVGHHIGQPIPMVSIEDLKGQAIAGKFYLDEVQLVT